MQLSKISSKSNLSIAQASVYAKSIISENETLKEQLRESQMEIKARQSYENEIKSHFKPVIIKIEDKYEKDAIVRSLKEQLEVEKTCNKNLTE